VVSVEVIQGPDKGRFYDLPDSENVIGRQSPTAELRDLTVSRHHAKVYPVNGKWMLEDLGSANGTYLNGIKITRASTVKRGDQIRVGSTLLVFGGARIVSAVDVDEDGRLVDAAIVATVPSNEDSVIIPTPEAGAQAIGNLRVIYDLMAEIGSIFDIDRLLDSTLEKIFAVLKADRGYIMLMDEAGKLHSRASRSREGGENGAVPISRTIINEVISKQLGVLSSNAMSDKRFASGKSVHDFGIRSAICVPIKGRQKILGVIHVDCSISQHTYSTEQLRLLTAIGYQAGLAIENVRLYESAVQSERLRAVGETVAFLSHHIKNILQALGGGIDLVEMGLSRDDVAYVRNAWPIVQRNLGRINDLILNMLAFSKARQPLRENINVNTLLTDCVELLAPRADERSVALMSDLDDVPAVPGDASGLHQALVNLLTNALDAVKDGSGVITVSSEYDSMAREVAIRVTDNGSGIAPEQMGRIFTPFYSSKGQKGTGLGLAVAQKVIREHNGRIEVQSKVGEGTTFTVRLSTQSVADSGETHGPGK
jgi:signal transduction histidine kinase/pSer/pThr/pTyr-binding forkhead associated (FHA) protein